MNANGSDILQVAAELLRVVTHEQDELGLPKSTPITARRIIQCELDRIQDELRLKAIRLKAIYDQRLKVAA